MAMRKTLKLLPSWRPIHGSCHFRRSNVHLGFPSCDRCFHGRCGGDLSRELFDSSSQISELRRVFEDAATQRRLFGNAVDVAKDLGHSSSSSPSAPTLPNRPNSHERVSLKSSLKESEAAKFAGMAETWWDHEGPYKPLHLMNPVRISFIRSALCRHFRKDPGNPRPFEGLRIIDVGCGGGLLSEPLARMGAHVVGIDAVETNIKIALAHAVSKARDPLTESIEYQCTTAEQLVQEKKQFDAVISLEETWTFVYLIMATRKSAIHHVHCVIEHVVDPQEFCNSLAALTSDNGAILISTINRSIRSYFMAIIAAEYVLGWLPRGTHDWSNFITPEELVMLMKHACISIQEMAGIVYDPSRCNWMLSDNTDINYIAFGAKHNLQH